MNKSQINCQIVILAAGNGTRMRSALPKVMHLVGDKPMIERVISNCALVTDDLILVHSQQLIKYITPYKHKCKFVLQSNPLGTAHAVDAAKELIANNKIVTVIYGDNPLITHTLIRQLVNHLNNTNSAAVTLSFKREDGAQYGRIVTDSDGNFLRIVEFKCANEAEKKITLCNSGIMTFAPGILVKYLPFCLHPEKNKEQYLTDIIEICQKNNEKVSYFLAPNQHEVIGVNTKEELIEANNILQ